MSRLHGPVIVAVLAEAFKRFGRITDYNRAEVNHYVQRRMRELANGESPQPYEPAGFDRKAAQTGEREDS